MFIRRKLSKAMMGEVMGGSECIFCSYDSNNKNIFFENEHSFSVLNFKPALPGHSLIFPKSHIVEIVDLKGCELESLMGAIQGTYLKLQSLFSNDSQFLKDYYNDLVSNPKSEESKELAIRMLKSELINKVPTGFNWGMNNGYNAGQREDHLHFHLFPRSSGLGIANAFRETVVDIE
jgi:diadenosine tetraphosphate (Ap4A) HIT family hydrolase